MVKEIVICPKCNEEVKAQGSIFFRHCGRAFIIKECLAEYSNKVHCEAEPSKDKKLLKPENIDTSIEETDVEVIKND